MHGGITEQIEIGPSRHRICTGGAGKLAAWSSSKWLKKKPSMLLAKMAT
jgi:hypothetical protein